MNTLVIVIQPIKDLRVTAMLTRIMIILLIFLPSFAHADSTPFSFFKKLINSDKKTDKQTFNYYCNERGIVKFSRGKQIAVIHLNISDFEYESGDVDLLGINSLSNFKKQNTSKEEIYKSFVKSIETHNPEREIALFINDDFEQYRSKCNKAHKGTDFNEREKCTKKTESYISAKYGNATVKFYCNLQVKGTKYPILIESSCSVVASDEFEYDTRWELHDLNALEETTIKKGVKRLLDRHIETLSEIFDIAKQCK